MRRGSKMRVLAVDPNPFSDLNEVEAMCFITFKNDEFGK